MADIVGHQRTPAGLRYERAREILRSRARNLKDPTIKAVNDELTRMKAVGPSTVHQNATMSSISVQYQNDEYIGARLMPDVTVGKLSDVYYIYPKRDRLAAPDDKIGPKGSANEISETRSTATYSCLPYGLKDYVDALTLANQDAPLNEMMDVVESVTDLMDLNKEIRIASALTTSGNYSGNTTTAGTKWDTASGGTIVKDMQDAKAACWTGRGAGKMIGFCSLSVWNVIARNPAILDLFKYNASGLALPKQVAGYFGLDDILVGAARKDTANAGQTASYSRIWGDVFGMVRVASSPGIRNAAWGYTFVMGGQRRTDVWFDNTLGTEGGYYGRVTTKEDHKVVAGDTGYLLTSVIT
jgi:hypothetical protein